MGLTNNFNKTEIIAINTDQEFHINSEENANNKQVHEKQKHGRKYGRR